MKIIKITIKSIKIRPKVLDDLVNFFLSCENEFTRTFCIVKIDDGLFEIHERRRQ